MPDDFAILSAVFGPESVEVPTSAAPDDPATVAANERDELVRILVDRLIDKDKVLFHAPRRIKFYSSAPRTTDPITSPEP